MDALEYIIEKIKEFGKLYAEGETTQTKKNKKKKQLQQTFSESKKEKKLLALKASPVKRSVGNYESVEQVP